MIGSTGSPGRAARVTARTLAIVVVAFGVAGGGYLGQERDRQQARADAAAESVAHRAELAALQRLADERTDRGERFPLQEAVRQAEQQAELTARQRGGRADQVQTSPAPEPAPDTGQSGSGPSEPVGPVPGSCGEYGGNRATGCTLLLAAGFSLGQMSCLDNLWTKESGWNERAQNPSSGAYGIPQALPGGKMSSHGSDWRTNPATQIRWGLDYIADRYGTPCAAWQHSQNTGWY